MKKALLILLLTFCSTVLANDNFSTLIVGKWKYDFMGVDSHVVYKKDGKVIYGEGTPQKMIGSWKYDNSKLTITVTLPDKTQITDTSKVLSFEKNKVVIKDSRNQEIILKRE